MKWFCVTYETPKVKLDTVIQKLNKNGGARHIEKILDNGKIKESYNKFGLMNIHAFSPIITNILGIVTCILGILTICIL